MSIFSNGYKTIADSLPSILIVISKKADTVIGIIFCTFQCHHLTMIVLTLFYLWLLNCFFRYFRFSLQFSFCFFQSFLFFFCLPRCKGFFCFWSKETIYINQFPDTFCNFCPCKQKLCCRLHNTSFTQSQTLSIIICITVPRTHKCRTGASDSILIL